MQRLVVVACVVVGVASLGVGAASAAVPTAPTGVTGTPGNGSVTVRWHAPSSGSPFTGYTATSTPGSNTCTTGGVAVSCTVTGLTNGTSYTFTVTATNASGTGPASAPSAAVTPRTIPGAPTAVTATAGNAQAKVSWTAPASTGGAAITKYTVTASGSGGQTCTWTTGTLTCTVTGLLNGISYTFTVTATNAAGTGPASTASNAVTPIGAPPPPTGVSATAGDQQATVSCTAPISNGGATITSYTATASPGGAHASAPSCPITVTGLTDGTAYTFTVTATSSLGTSAPSAASNKVTPVDTHAPSPPAGIAGRIVKGSLLLTWQASTDNVGVVRYEVYFNGAPLESVTSTQASERAFNPRGNSVYTVRAFDAAGNQSEAAGSVVVRPTPYPKGVPRNVPAWAWKILKWQQHGSKGLRPKAPKPLPHWYAAWKHWRLTPFQVVS
jgi:hypothetical protein